MAAHMTEILVLRREVGEERSQAERQCRLNKKFWASHGYPTLMICCLTPPQPLLPLDHILAFVQARVKYT